MLGVPPVGEDRRQADDLAILRELQTCFYDNVLQERLRVDAGELRV